MNSEAIKEQVRHFFIEKLELIIVDDQKNQYIPVFQFVIKNTDLVLKDSGKQIINLDFEFKLSYYNPNFGIIEPIIEKSNFLVCIITG